MSRRIYIFISTVLIILIIICCLLNNKHYRIQKQYNEVINKYQETINDEFDLYYYQKLYNNEDIIGMIKFADTESLIVQADDNEYYLNHLLDHSYNILGTPFLDYRSNIKDKKIIIYGHNAHKYQTAFKTLQKYLNQDFYENNKEIQLIINNDVMKYQIFSVSLYHNNYDYYQIKVNDWEKHINDLKSNSLYSIDINVDSSDDIIVLQTCSNVGSDTYIVVSGKKIKE